MALPGVQQQASMPVHACVGLCYINGAKKWGNDGGYYSTVSNPSNTIDEWLSKVNIKEKKFQ